MFFCHNCDLIKFNKELINFMLDKDELRYICKSLRACTRAGMAANNYLSNILPLYFDSNLNHSTYLARMLVLTAT